MKPVKLISFNLYLFIFLLFSVNLSAAPGDLDPTFGTNGKSVTPIGIVDIAGTAIAQSDGKIITLGDTILDNFDYEFSLMRYNPNGSLDSGFGTNGIVLPNQAGNQFSAGMGLLADGKIIVVCTDAPAPTTFNVYRFNQNGTLDSTFGTNGKVVSDFGSTVRGYGIALQADGKIVVAGSINVNNSPKSAVFRLNADGSPDLSFNSVGYTTANGVSANKTAIQSDGKIVVTGKGNSANSFWARFTSNGTLEGSQIFGALSFVFDAVAIQPDGKIVFAGNNRGLPNGPTFAVTRYNADKTLDTSFGNAGVSKVVWGTGFQSNAYALMIQPDGRIVVGGSGGAYPANGMNSFALARFNPNGFLDVGFGSRGKGYTIFPSGSSIRDIVRQPDGKIVAIGQASGFAAARYDGSGSNVLVNRTAFDYDGDGRADIGIIRDSGASNWYIIGSLTNSLISSQWGNTENRKTPGDFDGDGKADFSYRSQSSWLILWSSFDYPVSQTIASFGQEGDISVPADYDGDRIDDAALYLNGNWAYAASTAGNLPRSFYYGLPTDKPVPADYDGDGKADFAVFRPSFGDWYIHKSSNNEDIGLHFGISTDLPVPADYDGDGKADIAVFRPSVGDWYWLNSSDGSFTGVHWGATGDKPVPADYDGDGKTDIGVFRPSDGNWYLFQSTAGFKSVNWGISTDIPIPNVYIR